MATGTVEVSPFKGFCAGMIVHEMYAEAISDDEMDRLLESAARRVLKKADHHTRKIVLFADIANNIDGHFHFDNYRFGRSVPTGKLARWFCDREGEIITVDGKDFEIKQVMWFNEDVLNHNSRNNVNVVMVHLEYPKTGPNNGLTRTSSIQFTY